MLKACRECKWFRQCLNDYGSISNLAEHRGINILAFAADCWEEAREENNETN